jgi:hypothetical protein
MKWLFINIDVFGKTFIDKMVDLDDKLPGLLKDLHDDFVQKKLVRNKFCRLQYLWCFDLPRIHAEVVTRVAGSLEAGGLPGYPEVLFVEINVTKLCSNLFYTIIEDSRS